MAKGADKTEKVYVYQHVTDLINKGEFPDKYATYVPADGVRLIVKLSKGDARTFTLVACEEVVNAIVRYTRDNCVNPDFHLGHAEAIQCMKYWRGYTTPIPTPKPFIWPDEEGYAHRVLPWRPEPGAMPTWSKLLDIDEDGKITGDKNRKEETEAALAWIGSLFVPESYGQQYLWIYGPGGNGKGAIARFLGKVFGPASHTINHVPKNPGPFWSSQLLGKRFVVFSDCENFHFPAGGLFKSLSGGDPITVEIKNGPIFSQACAIKFLFISNQMPSLSTEAADLRRALFLGLYKNDEHDPAFEGKLWEEGGAFLWLCLDYYKQYCPSHGPINTENAQLVSWVDTLQQNYENTFQNWFVQNIDSTLDSRYMQQALEMMFENSRSKQIEFVRFLSRDKGVEKRRDPVAEAGTKIRRYRYHGITLNYDKFKLVIPHCNWAVGKEVPASKNVQLSAKLLSLGKFNDI